MKMFLLLFCFLSLSVHGQSEPITRIKAEASGLFATSPTIRVPSNTVTKVGSVEARIETGNRNLIHNASFEHITNGFSWNKPAPWTVSSSTGVDGGKSGQITMTSLAGEVYQSSSVNAANLVGLQGVVSAFVKTSVSGVKVCAKINGTTSTTLCNNVVADGLWREYIIPVILGGTSNGISINKLGTETGDVFVDNAFVGTSAPFQNVTSESVFSAKVTSVGVVSDESANFISGNCSVSTATFTCNFTSLFFTVAPNCEAVTSNTGTTADISSGTSATATAATVQTNNAGTPSAQPFTLFCQKQGVDSPLASKIYSQASQDYDWTSYTPTFTGFGTVTNATFWHKREGSDLLIRGNFQTGTLTATTPSLTLPNSLSIDTTKIPSVVSLCSISQRGISATSGSQYTNYTAINPSTPTVLKFATGNNGLTGTNEITNATISFGNGEWQSISTCRIPIQGWQDYGVIVGSFAETPKTPGASNTDFFSVSYGTTNLTTDCSASPCFIDQIGSNVTSITWTSAGNMTMNLPKTYAQLKCSIVAVSSTATNIAPTSRMACENCNSLTITTVNGSGTNTNTRGTILCQGKN